MEDSLQKNQLFGTYTKGELKSALKQHTSEWDDDLILYVHDIMSGELFDQWLENHSDKQYEEYAKDVIRDITGTDDDDEDFSEEDKQMRLF